MVKGPTPNSCLQRTSVRNGFYNMKWSITIAQILIRVKKARFFKSHNGGRLLWTKFLSHDKLYKVAPCIDSFNLINAEILVL
jgi:hypothetical protein